MLTVRQFALAAAKKPAEERRAASKKSHANYADSGQEARASKLVVESDAKEDVNEAIDEGDKAADKINAQVDKEDGDFDPDNAAEDEVEAVPEDEADDAGGQCFLARDTADVCLVVYASLHVVTMHVTLAHGVR